jgi:hypothetical protein
MAHNVQGLPQGWIQGTSDRCKCRFIFLRLKVKTKSQIGLRLPEQKLISEQKVEDTSVRQPCGKPLCYNKTGA